MPNYTWPGVYVEEVASGLRPITPVGTSTLAVVGAAPKADAHVNEAFPVNNWSQFLREFVPTSGTIASTPLSHAVFGFFLNGGSRCYVVNVGPNQPITGAGRDRAGLQVLEQLDNINIVAAPGFTDQASCEALIAHCELLRDRVAIIDPPQQVTDIDDLTKVMVPPKPTSGGGAGSGGGTASGAAAEGNLRPRVTSYATFYFPWVRVADPLSGNLVYVPPSGHMAGVWARTDTTRGVHKAPANEVVRGALDLSYAVTNAEQGELNAAGVNCIRFFDRDGILVWGARTLDEESSEWRYLNLRRLFIMIEQSILRSTRWLVFEPNERSTWKNVIRDCSAFLTHLWRDGALVGRTPQEAFFVQCDEETNPQESIDLGMLVTVIGVAAVKPAEFIVFRLHQWEGASAISAVA